MTQIRLKKVPFDLGLAKKITNKELSGRIVNGIGEELRIICWDMKGIYPIIALNEMPDGNEGVNTYDENGRMFETPDSASDLHIEVPTYYKDYSNFEPCKWQPCLVRDSEEDDWNVLVCAGKNSDGDVLFYEESGETYTWYHVLPLSKITERLIGTTKSYEELIKELDAKSIASTKHADNE